MSGRRHSGFTIVEMLIASAVMLTITGAIVQLVNPARHIFQAQPELADVQQRLRVAADAVTRDLLMAGAGMSAAPWAGPLSSYLAPVLPYRAGDASSDPEARVYFRDDTISLLYVPPTSSQASIRHAIPQSAGQLEIDPRANCPPAAPDHVCGFGEGMRALLFDVSGAWNPITVAGVQGTNVDLTYAGGLSVAYPAGAAIAQLAAHTYYFKAETSQLMHYDGESTDLPVVDDVVALRFEYYGDPQPPRRLPGRALAEPTGPWTTYGPKPPPAGVASPFAWPDGENCTFRVEAGEHTPRLPVLNGGAGLVRLEPALLTDGPWCPSAISAHRFDADLLRIRRVRVTLRVQAAIAGLRGRGALFMRPGTASAGGHYVPDQEIRFDIAPRNLNLAR